MFEHPFLKIIFRFTSHLFFWVIVYFGFTYFLGYGSRETDYVNLFSAFLMPITMVISYFLSAYLIPKYLLQKKYKLFILYSIYTLILSVYLIIMSVLFGLVYTLDLKPENTSPLTKTLPLIILGVFFVAIIFVALNLVKHNYKSIIKNEDLEKKFLETKLALTAQELQFLKMQIHPHFLFNSLNTIYAFTLQKKEEAPEMILKLSNLLDYILYQVQNPKVLLKNEIAHLKDYISLEKMRFQEGLEVDFFMDIENENIEIAPMMFIPFVENSFKHGVQENGILKVDVKLTAKENLLFFEIKNAAKNSNDSKGIGLENSKKRLNLLYSKYHELIISNSSSEFKVSLKIKMINNEA